MGAFHPSAVGESLARVLTGPGCVFREAARRRHALARETGADDVVTESDYAAVAIAQSQLDALELELRGPDGRPVPTEWIAIQDTEDLARFGEDVMDWDDLEEPPYDPELEAAVMHDLELLDEWFDDDGDSDLGWEADEDRGEFPRYQIQVELKEPL